MKVRVCGPNLSSRAQNKGSLHVHADGCGDLRKYGPQYRGKDAMGGDLNGNREPLLDCESKVEVMREIYADHIAEQPKDETIVDFIHSLVNDTYWAPCVKDLPFGTIAYYEEPEVMEETTFELTATINIKLSAYSEGDAEIKVEEGPGEWEDWDVVSVTFNRPRTLESDLAEDR